MNEKGKICTNGHTSSFHQNYIHYLVHINVYCEYFIGTCLLEYFA
jgi:hypothetical protein